MTLSLDDRGVQLVSSIPCSNCGIDYNTNKFNSNLGSFFASKMQFQLYGIANLIAFEEIQILIIEPTRMIHH